MKVSSRLFLGFSFTAAVAITAAGGGYVAIGRLNDSAATVSQSVANMTKEQAEERQRVTALERIAIEIAGASEVGQLESAQAELTTLLSAWPAAEPIIRQILDRLIPGRTFELTNQRQLDQDLSSIRQDIEAVLAAARGFAESAGFDVLIGMSETVDQIQTAQRKGGEANNQLVMGMSKIAFDGLDKVRAAGEVGKWVSNSQLSILRLRHAKDEREAGAAFTEFSDQLDNVQTRTAALPAAGAASDSLREHLARLMDARNAWRTTAVANRPDLITTVMRDLNGLSAASTAISESLGPEVRTAVESATEEIKVSLVTTAKESEKVLLGMSSTSERLLNLATTASELRFYGYELNLLLRRAATAASDDVIRYAGQDLGTLNDAADRHLGALSPEQAKSLSEMIEPLRKRLKAFLDLRQQLIHSRTAQAELRSNPEGDKAGTTLTSGIANLKLAAEQNAKATTQRAEEIQRAGQAEGVHWQHILIAAAVAAGILSMVCGVLITRSIIRPVQSVRASLGRVADGDLTTTTSIQQKDELGQMASTLDATVVGLRGMIGGITQHSQSMAGAATKLSSVSTQMSETAKTTADQSSQAASAAFEISTSITTVTAGFKEMGNRVDEISQSADQAAKVAQEGVAVAQSANTAMTRLGNSSNEIGDIVKVITAIAKQTNLLALNATIEAARAGESGRGFAVVANEVKVLALRTAEATADIGQRVTGIQSDSQAAQESLARIIEIVGKINDLQHSIAGAVELQSATTKDLGGNIAQVAQAGIDIAKNVTAVADAAKESLQGATGNLTAAEELSRIAVDLRDSVSRFRV